MEHEPGSFAADRQVMAAELERHGVHLVQDDSSSRPMARREAVKKMTDEQLLSASNKTTRASAAAAKPAAAAKAKRNTPVAAANAGPNNAFKSCIHIWKDHTVLQPSTVLNSPITVYSGNCFFWELLMQKAVQTGVPMF